MASTEDRIEVVQVGVQGPPGAGLGSHEDEDQTLMHVRQVTSTTRPAAPIEGQVIYETDTNLYKIYSGTAWVDYPTAIKAPSFRAYRNSTQSLASGTTNTRLQIDTVGFDPFGGYDTVNFEYVIPAGYDNTVWVFVAQVNWASLNNPDDGDYRRVDIKFDSGSGDTANARTQLWPPDNVQMYQQVTAIQPRNSGDKVYVVVGQESAGAAANNIQGGSASTFFTGYCIGRQT